MSVVLRGRLDAAQEGRTGIAGAGDVISYETSHPVILPGGRAVRVALRARADAPPRTRGRPDQQAHRAQDPGQRGLPRVAVAFFRGLVDGLEDGTITADDSPNAVECVLDLVRGMYAVPAHSDRAEAVAIARGDPPRRPVVHRGEPRRPRSRSRPVSPVRASSRRATCTSCSRAKGRACASGSARLAWSAAGATCSIRLSAISRSSRSRAAGACPARSISAACSVRPTAARRASTGTGRPPRSRAMAAGDPGPAGHRDLGQLRRRACRRGRRPRVGGGQLVGLIGPNGAGKTTFIDAISGFVALAGPGRARRARPHRRCAPHARARAGSRARGSRSSSSTTSRSARTSLVAAYRPSVWRTLREIVVAASRATPPRSTRC